MRIFLIHLAGAVVLMWGTAGFGQTERTKPAVKDTVKADRYASIAVKGILTEPELRGYRPDLWLLNFAARGRMATSTYRGMPAGTYRFRYHDHPLDNPVTGFWNEQWLPFYQIGSRSEPFGAALSAYQPPAPQSRKPASHIVYSQDYITNISLIDINFTRYWNSRNFVQLSGNNFLGDETDLPNRRYRLNTYRARVHWEYEHSQWDAYYWQMRQRFNLAVDSVSIDNFKQIGHILWLRGQWQLSERLHWLIVPAYTAVEDRLKPGNLGDWRDLRYKIAQVNSRFFHKTDNGSLGVAIFGQAYQTKHLVAPATRTETAGRASLFWMGDGQSWQHHFEGGGFYDSAAEITPEFEAGLTKKFGERAHLGVRALSRASVVPLLWRTVQADSLPPFSGEKPIRFHSVTGSLRIGAGQWLDLQIEPFASRVENYPLLENNRWSLQEYENYGVRAALSTRLWRFWIGNDITWNGNYNESFAPQVKHVFSAKTTVTLFKNALRLDGITHWQFWGYYYSLDFQEHLNQFVPGGVETGPYIIGDARIQAHFRNATVFFVWENLLSEDYFIVNRTLEQLLIFRLGIDWILFN